MWYFVIKYLFSLVRYKISVWVKFCSSILFASSLNSTEWYSTIHLIVDDSGLVEAGISL